MPKWQQRVLWSVVILVAVAMVAGILYGALVVYPAQH